jgi:diguanylate cyclase (GGDEF)-like protein
MSAPVQTIHREETVKTAIEFLKEKGFKRAIVIDDQGKVDGIVTQRELINITYGRWAELMKLHAHELGELVHVLESENQQLKVESLTDTLTGVGNRRRFNQILESEIGRYYRQDMTPFSILMLDIDFFKKINDTHGHLVGDQILNALCKRISALLRVSDEITRWGGEEFAVILPTASSKSALALAERMRADVAQNPFGDIKVTISIGAAEYHRGESLEELLHRADQALYAAKQGGRNKVVLAE